MWSHTWRVVVQTLTNVSTRQSRSPYTDFTKDPTNGQDPDFYPGPTTTSPCAVAICSGMAPIGLGPGTDRQPWVPDDRANLYTIKFTRGKVRSQGTWCHTRFVHSLLGVLAKSPADLAVALDIVTPLEGEGNTHTSALKKGFHGQRIGFIDPEYSAGIYMATLMEDVEEQIVRFSVRQ